MTGQRRCGGGGLSGLRSPARAAVPRPAPAAGAHCVRAHRTACARARRHRPPARSCRWTAGRPGPARRLEAGILDLQPGQLRAVAPAHGAERQRRLAGDHLALFHIARPARPRHQPVRFLAHDGLAGRRHQEGGVAVDVEQHARAQAHDLQESCRTSAVSVQSVCTRLQPGMRASSSLRVSTVSRASSSDSRRRSTRRRPPRAVRPAKGLVRIAEEHQHAVRADGRDGAQAVIGARGEPGVIRMQVASERPAGPHSASPWNEAAVMRNVWLWPVFTSRWLCCAASMRRPRVEHGGGLGRAGEHQWRGGQAGAAQETGQAGMAEQGAQWSSFLLGRAFKHSTRGRGAAWRSGLRRSCPGVSHKPCMGTGARL